MERETGFEPATSTLARLRSSQLSYSRKSESTDFDFLVKRITRYGVNLYFIKLRCITVRLDIGGESRNRTDDARIFSPSLYQLSYLALVGAEGVEPPTFWV